MALPECRAMRWLVLVSLSVVPAACGTSNTIQRVTPDAGNPGGAGGAFVGASGGASTEANGGSALGGSAGSDRGGSGAVLATAGAAGFGGETPSLADAGEAGTGTSAPAAAGAGGVAAAPTTHAGDGGTGQGTAGAASIGGGAGAPDNRGGAGAASSCTSASECPEASGECQLARCDAGACTVVDRAANAPCSLGICTGTGICGECVPQSGDCSGRTPRVCGADGQWDSLSDCPTLSTCHKGRCLLASIDWIWQTTGEGAQSAVGLTPTIDGDLLVGGNFSGTTRIDDLYEASPSGAAVITRLDRASGVADAIVAVAPTDGMASLEALAVAPNGTFVLGAAVSGSLDGVDHGNAWGLTRRVRADLGDVQSSTELWPGNTGTLYGGVEGVAAANTESYVLASYEQEIWWPTSSPPYLDAEVENGCRMFLARLDHTGEPTWTASYAWCTGIDRKVLRLGLDGDLYVGGPGGSPNHSSAPVILGTTTIADDASAVVAKFDPASGNVARVRSLPCAYGPSYRSGRVHDLAMLANGDVLAAVTCESSFAPDGLTLPDGRGFLVRLDANLDVLQARPIGTVLDDTTWFDALALAVGPDENIYVTGTLADGRYDFGAGPHAYQGTCFRCGPGDAFVASYTSELEPRWSLPIASPGQDTSTAIACDADRVYVATQLGGPATVLGRDLVVEGPADAVVFSFQE